MKKAYILIVGLVLTTAIIGCSKSEVQSTWKTKDNVEVSNTKEIVKKEEIEDKTEKGMIDFSQQENVFGFADASEKKLITLPNGNDSLKNPEEFNVAIGNNGEFINIRFIKEQEPNDKDNSRQSITNFDNMKGYIYEAQDGQLAKDKTYMLSKDTTIKKDALVKLVSTKNANSASNYYKSVKTETIKKIEALKNKKVKDSQLLAETEDEGKICLFVFERDGDDMLASLSYIKGDKVIIKDYPAKYNENSTWRIDAGDDPGFFEVMFLAESTDGLLLGLTWGAPEGETAYILKEENGVFQETDLACSRYWAP